MDTTKVRSKIQGVSPSLQSQVKYYRRASARLEAAKHLAERKEQIIRLASPLVAQKYPEHTSSEIALQACTRDIGFLVQILIYTLVSDSREPVEQWLTGIVEVYKALNLKTECSLFALQCISENHGLVLQEAQETTTYIEYLQKFFSEA